MRGPLLGGHGAGAGIGQQVDQDVARLDQEQVVAGRLEIPLALLARGVAQRLDALDAEWLDDGAHSALLFDQQRHSVALDTVGGDVQLRRA